MYSVLKHVSALSILIPLITMLIKIKVLDNTLRIFSLFIGVSALADLLGFIFSINAVSTIEVFKVYTLCEGVILLIVYSSISFDIYKRILLYFFLPAYFSVWMLSQYYVLDFGIMNAIECIMLVIICSVFFADVVFLRFKIIQPSYTYFYAINASIFLYFGINLVLFFFEDTVRFSSIAVRHVSWSIHLITHISFNLLIAVGIARKR